MSASVRTDRTTNADPYRRTAARRAEHRAPSRPWARARGHRRSEAALAGHSDWATKQEGCGRGAREEREKAVAGVSPVDDWPLSRLHRKAGEGSFVREPSVSELLRYRSLVRLGGRCWIWTGELDRSGRPVMSPQPAGDQHHCLRIAWWLEHGDWPPGGSLVRQACRNGRCVRPDHLVLARARVNSSGRSGAALISTDASIDIRRQGVSTPVPVRRDGAYVDHQHRRADDRDARPAGGRLR